MKRVARVEKAFTVLHSGARHEHLGHGVSVPGKTLSVEVDQADLADGSRCLFLGNGVPGSLPAEFVGAHGDGSRGDEDHLGSPFPECRHLARDFRKDPRVHGSVAGEDAAPHLQDDAAGVSALGAFGGTVAHEPAPSSRFSRCPAAALSSASTPCPVAAETRKTWRP